MKKRETAVDAPSIATVVRRLIEADELDFLYSRVIELSADLFTEHPCAVVTRRDGSFWVDVAYPARKTLHFPLPISRDLSHLPFDGVCHRVDDPLPEMGDSRFLFFPIGHRDDTAVWGDGWYCIEQAVADDAELLEEVTLFVTVIREAVRKIAKIERIKEMTIIDEVSGLFNTRHLFSLLDQAISQGVRYLTGFSLIFFDLDRFKLVNDTHGHLVGSRILREVGQLVVQHLRKADVAFRYGGDEFVVFLPYTSKEHARVVVERLWESLRRHQFEVDGIPIRITASYGVAGFPEDGRTAKEIIAKADEMMYRVKRQSRDGFEVA